VEMTHPVPVSAQINHFKEHNFFIFIHMLPVSRLRYIRNCLPFTDFSSVAIQSKVGKTGKFAADSSTSLLHPSVAKRTEAKEASKGTLHIYEGVNKMKEIAWAKFDETADICIKLGVDPTKQNQNVKGIARLPHGTGKKIRVGVFALGADAEVAIKSGADEVGSTDLVKKIQDGDLNFNRIIATPEMMPMVAKIAKVSYLIVFKIILLLKSSIFVEDTWSSRAHA